MLTFTFCQVGERHGTGFFLSPMASTEGPWDLADPESIMLRIKHTGTDFEVGIHDDRLTDYERLPGLDEAE